MPDMSHQPATWNGAIVSYHRAATRANGPVLRIAAKHEGKKHPLDVSENGEVTSNIDSRESKWNYVMINQV